MESVFGLPLKRGEASGLTLRGSFEEFLARTTYNLGRLRMTHIFDKVLRSLSAFRHMKMPPGKGGVSLFR